MNVSGQIVNAFKDVLTGLTTTGARVHRALALPLSEQDVPALSISLGAASLDEDLTSGMSNGGIAEVWIQEIVIVVAVKEVDSETAENTFLKIKSEIVVALFSDPTLGISIKDLIIKNVSAPEIDATGDKTSLSAEISCEVMYQTQRGVPDAILN